MNIFFLDRDPIKAAQQHCDKHVVKMILETGQLLSTAHRLLDGDEYADRYGLYKVTHKNHPSAAWARANNNSYRWLYDMFIALGEEYTYRYNKVHATIQKLRDPLSSSPWNAPQAFMSEPPQCMPDDVKALDSVTAYRNYYRIYKAPILKYTRRAAPEWLA